MLKKIWLTFDYELFLKKTGSIYNCLLKPVEVLLSFCKKFDINVTFFVDAVYLYRLKKENNHEFKQIEHQLHKTLMLGHDIELHIHPIWKFANQCTGKWFFESYKYYRLNSLSLNQLREIFNRACDILYLIGKKVRPSYKLKAFRAGGWDIIPFNKIRACLKENEIFIDSSCAYGIYYSISTHKIDFRDMPELPVYRFNKSPLQKDDSGEFIEVPISTFKCSFIKRLTDKLIKLSFRNFYAPVGDGRGIKISTIRNYFGSQYRMFTIDNISFYILDTAIEQAKTVYLTFISHPKSLSKASFSILKKLYEKYEFIDYKEIIKSAGTNKEDRFKI